MVFYYLFNYQRVTILVYLSTQISKEKINNTDLGLENRNTPVRYQMNSKGEFWK